MIKETYFTPETIASQTTEFASALGSYINRRKICFDPPRSALLVLDMQEYFLQSASHAFVPSAPAIIPRINQLVQTYRRLGYPIIFTRHINTHQNAGMMDHWWSELIQVNNPLSEITAKFDISSSIVLPKSQYDAFFGTDLDDILQSNEIRQVVITGVMTHLCCETTARSAFTRGLEVFFPVDGTATYNRHFHEATLINLAHGFAMTPRTDELISEFQ